MDTAPLQARFDEISAAHFAAPLCDRYRIRTVSASEWAEVFPRVRDEALPSERAVDMQKVSTDAESRRWAALRASYGGRPLVHRLVFEDGADLAGCYWGEQDGLNRYYMVFSAIRPAHQGRGLYSAFLPRLLATAAQMGFNHVWSRHQADNNQVLVPKLKVGFVIGGFEVAPNYGLMVHLRRYLTGGLEQLYRYRVDGTRNAAELRQAGILREE